MRLKRKISFMAATLPLIFFLISCSVARDLIDEEKLLDEEALVRVLAQEMDSKKDEAIEKLGAETERVGKELVLSIKKDILNEIKPAILSLDKKHSDLLSRLPWYGVFLMVLVWGASLIDDIVRYFFHKWKKRT